MMDPKQGEASMALRIFVASVWSIATLSVYRYEVLFGIDAAVSGFLWALIVVSATTRKGRMAHDKSVEEARGRLQVGNYLPWTNAGGPNECKHGYAAGIPCRQCDELTAAAPSEAVESAGCDMNCKSAADCDGSCASDEDIAKFATPQPLDGARLSGAVEIDGITALLMLLRECGWSVAVHNDYRLNDCPHTFWLFTHPSGVWVKGEGETDIDALRDAWEAAIDQIKPSSQPDAESLAADNKNWHFICGSWTIRLQQGLDYVYRCDMPEGHTGDHEDHVLLTNWSESRPESLAALREVAKDMAQAAGSLLAQIDSSSESIFLQNNVRRLTAALAAYKKML